MLEEDHALMVSLVIHSKVLARGASVMHQQPLLAVMMMDVKMICQSVTCGATIVNGILQTQIHAEPTMIAILRLQRLAVHVAEVQDHQLTMMIVLITCQFQMHMETIAHGTLIM